MATTMKIAKRFHPQALSERIEKSSKDSIASVGSLSEWNDPSQTIIVYDWDDTLCPSSWIRANRPALSYFRPCPKDDKYQKPLMELQQAVISLLEKSLALGKVVIVTNARDPWVTTSCNNFMPQVAPYLERIPIVYAQTIWNAWGLDSPVHKPVPIAVPGALRRQTPSLKRNNSSSIAGVGLAISGTSPTFNRNTDHTGSFAALRSMPDRDLYQNSTQTRKQMSELNMKLFSPPSPMNARPPKQNPNSTSCERAILNQDVCLKWKALTISTELAEFYSRYANQTWKNVISVGDSEYERIATRLAVDSCSPSSSKKQRVKTVKMMEEPHVRELTAQVRRVSEALITVVNYDDPLDVVIDQLDIEKGMHFGC